MDIEQFKLIIDLLEKAGSGAFTIAVLYTVLPVVSTVLHWCGIGVVFMIISKLIKSLVRNNALEASIVTAIDTDSYLSSGEKTKVIDCLKKHYN